MRGDLVEITAADVCRELAASSASGILAIDGPDGPGRVVLAAGRIIAAVSPAPRARLGDRLVGAGELDPDDLAAALDAQEESGQSLRLGTLLVEQGLVRPDAVRVFVQEQLLDALFEIVRWRYGAFAFMEDDGHDSVGVSLSLAVDDALVEVARRQQEWQELSRVIPDLESVPSFREGAASASASLEPDEFAVLASVDGERSIRALASDLGYGEFEAARIVYGLSLLGIVDVHLPRDAVGAALEEALAFVASEERASDPDEPPARAGLPGLEEPEPNTDPGPTDREDTPDGADIPDDVDIPDGADTTQESLEPDVWVSTRRDRHPTVVHAQPPAFGQGWPGAQAGSDEDGHGDSGDAPMHEPSRTGLPAPPGQEQDEPTFDITIDVETAESTRGPAATDPPAPPDPPPGSGAEEPPDVRTAQLFADIYDATGPGATQPDDRSGSPPAGDRQPPADPPADPPPGSTGSSHAGGAGQPVPPPPPPEQRGDDSDVYEFLRELSRLNVDPPERTRGGSAPAPKPESPPKPADPSSRPAPSSGSRQGDSSGPRKKKRRGLFGRG